MATFEPRPLLSTDPRLPAAEHPGLLPHQLALLHRMLALEAGCDSLPVPPPAGARGTGHLLTTQVGVLADKAGSGKTYTLLELMRVAPPPLRCTSVTQLTELSYVRTAPRAEGEPEPEPDPEPAPEPEPAPGAPVTLPITLLALPHNISTQWRMVADE
jgi:hypothetical protein